MTAQPVTVTIEKLVQGGRGLARQNGKVLLVRGAIPAETVDITPGPSHAQYQEATVRKVHRPSPNRVEAPCPVYGQCGGCHLQHIRYETQLALKWEMLTETLSRVGGLAGITIGTVVPSPQAVGYRSTVRFVVFRQGTGLALGFHEEGSHRPVAAPGCLLVHETARPIVAAIHARLTTQRTLPVRIESLEVRCSASGGAIHLAFRVVAGNPRRAEHLFGLFADLPGVGGQTVTDQKGHRWVHGDDALTEHLAGLTFRISEQSLMQVNWPLTATLSRMVGEWILGTVPQAEPSRIRVLALYAGIGTLGLPLARCGALVTLVEANKYAIADARHTAKVNHVGRVRFRHMKAEDMLVSVEPGIYDVVLMAPPRVGLTPACVRALLRSEIGRLLYVSCDSATLARDLKMLCQGGYRLLRVQPFDMVPQTAYLEIVAELALE